MFESLVNSKGYQTNVLRYRNPDGLRVLLIQKGIKPNVALTSPCTSLRVLLIQKGIKLVVNEIISILV